MKGVRRFDRGELSKPVRQPNGWVRAEGFITRVGVFKYRRADGAEIREYRPAEEVFKTDSIESFKLVPLTNNHPPEGLLDATNTKQHQVGTIEAPRADGKFMRSPMLVTDSDAIKEMESGKVQLSCGYVCDLDETPGEFEGERYDCVQRNIRGNHVALVATGRAGPDVKARMDSADGVMVPSPEPIQKESTETTMKKFRIDGVEYEVSESAAQALEKQAKAHDAEVSALKAKAEAAQAKADSADAEVKKVKDELASAPKRIREEISIRMALEAKAREVLGEDEKFDGLNDTEVRRKVAEHVHGIKLDGKSEAYVAASYDLAVAKAKSDEADEDAEETRDLEERTDSNGRQRLSVEAAKRRYQDALAKHQPS